MKIYNIDSHAGGIHTYMYWSDFGTCKPQYKKNILFEKLEIIVTIHATYKHFKCSQEISI